MTVGKILVLSSRIPYPLVGGDRNRVYNISKILATKYQVDLLAINESGIKRGELNALDKVFNRLILFNFDLLTLKVNAFKKILSSKPIQVTGYYFITIQRWIDEHFKEYDLIYCNHVRTAEYARGLPCKKVLDFHDAISMNYKDALRKAKGFWKIFYFIEDKRLLPYELEVLRDFDKYFITSQADKDYLLANTLPADIKVIPMGVNENVLRRRQNVEEENWIVFLGKMNYYPNEDAAVYFARQVFPLLRSKVKNVKFIIVGAYPTRKIQALSKIPGVEVTGFVDDPYEYLERAKVVVAPIRLGAGIQNKILEAMALRKPVVTTSKGARGIAGGEDGKHFVVADSPEGMAEKILALLNAPERRRVIGQNARALIEEKYTWDVIGAKLLAEIEKII